MNIGQGGKLLPHARILKDPHYSLDPIHGYTLLESAEPCKRKSLFFCLFLTLKSRALSLTGWAMPVQQMGSCEVCGRADSLSLWPGSLGSHGAPALTGIPVRLLMNALLAHSLPTCPPSHVELKLSQQNVTFSFYWAQHHVLLCASDSFTNALTTSFLKPI